MARKILLTSLSAEEDRLSLRYFSFQKEFGFDYCDALLSAEAGIKAVLSRYDIDEVIVIGGGGVHGGDDLKDVPLSCGSAFYSEDKASLSAYKLLLCRMAQYADELTPEQDAQNNRLPEELRGRLIRFTEDFREKTPELNARKPNRLFDVFSQDDQLYQSFLKALFEAFPELSDNFGSCIQWIKNYLYGSLKLSAKSELLSVNEKVRIRFIAENNFEEGSGRAESMMSMERSIVGDDSEIDLYISLNSDDAADTFIIINMLDILVSMPGSKVHLKKIFTVRSLQKRMTGIIRDDTDGFGITELFHGIRAFLNYGKADMIAGIWEKSGERNASIASMVYAMRHVDVGLSTCNVAEVEAGILRLRDLFRDESFLQAFGYYGVLFGMIAESIREDYGVLLEGEGDIPFIELVKWAYRHQFYQQTLTLIESRAPETLVKSGIFYYCGDEALRQHVTELFARQRLELKPYEYYKMDQLDHYFVKTYNRSGIRGAGARNEDPQRIYAALRVQSVENKDPSLITGFTACDSMETLQNLLFAYYHIGKVRNKISHADTDAMTETRLMVSESDDSSALVWMKDGIDYFIDSYEKAMAEVHGKAVQVIIITGEEVRRTAEHMRHDRRKGG